VSQAGEGLPEGIGSLSAACAGEGWALAISGATLLDWAEDHGWRRLGVEADAILGAVAGGVAVAGPGDRIGLWKPGPRGSVGWLGIPDLREIAIADERMIVVTVRGMERVGVAVCVLGPSGLELAQEADLDPSLDLAVLLGAARAPDGAALFVGRDHILRLRTRNREVHVATALRWPAGFGSAPGSVTVGHRLGQAAGSGEAVPSVHPCPAPGVGSWRTSGGPTWPETLPVRSGSSTSSADSTRRCGRSTRSSTSCSRAASPERSSEGPVSDAPPTQPGPAGPRWT
jgi:hypothetical protein